MVNALGRTPDEIWPRLLAADRSGFHTRDDIVPGRSLWLAEVEGRLPRIPQRLRRFDCRNNALTAAALEQIESRISDVVCAVGAERVGVVMGTSTSGVSDAEAAIRHRVRTQQLTESFDYDQLELGGTASFVAELLGLGGPAYTISTACSSGARALASARSLISIGLCDAVVAGATDSICGLTTNGFSALQAISDEVTNPCSANRRGLTLGEGSAVFLVTRGDADIRLRGVGESSEGHHMSAPDPSGEGAEKAMCGALRDADLDASDIVYLNLHGTGTTLNDAMECAAIERVFERVPPCSSTKSLVGHTLGAAGAMEAGFCWMVLERALREPPGPAHLALPPHAFDGEVDPALGALDLARAGAQAPMGAIMSNSFGFGGNNCTLVLEASPS